MDPVSSCEVLRGSAPGKEMDPPPGFGSKISAGIRGSERTPPATLRGGFTVKEKTVKLKDQTEVVIRPMKKDDLDRSLAFFVALPEEDRAYLRVDVTNREIVEQRIREIRTGRVKRLVALARGQIVADGALELSREEWKKHVGELRLIVARPFQRKGLGVVMARELYALAAASKVEEIVVKMMRPQVAALSIFRKLGFHEEVLLPHYVRDLTGKKQDLVIMRCDLEALWREMEDFMGDFDWMRTRCPYDIPRE